MIATSHVIVGGTIATIATQNTQNPIIGIGLGLAIGMVSHLLCDMLPHLDLPPGAKFIGDEVVWDKNLYIFAITDSLVAFFLTLFLWYWQFDLSILSPFAWGALGGYLPDLVDNLPLWKDKVHTLPFFKQFHQLHLRIHKNWQSKYPMPKYWILGTATQLVTVIPSLWFILK